MRNALPLALLLIVGSLSGSDFGIAPVGLTSDGRSVLLVSESGLLRSEPRPALLAYALSSREARFVGVAELEGARITTGFGPPLRLWSNSRGATHVTEWDGDAWGPAARIAVSGPLGAVSAARGAGDSMWIVARTAGPVRPAARVLFGSLRSGFRAIDTADHDGEAVDPPYVVPWRPRALNWGRHRIASSGRVTVAMRLVAASANGEARLPFLREVGEETYVRVPFEAGEGGPEIVTEGGKRRVALRAPWPSHPGSLPFEGVSNGSEAGVFLLCSYEGMGEERTSACWELDTREAAFREVLRLTLPRAESTRLPRYWLARPDGARIGFSSHVRRDGATRAVLTTYEARRGAPLAIHDAEFALPAR